MQIDGLYKEREPLKWGDERLRKENKNCVEPSCIRDLKLFMNICSSARSEVVLFPNLVPLFMIHLDFFSINLAIGP